MTDTTAIRRLAVSPTVAGERRRPSPRSDAMADSHNHDLAHRFAQGDIAAVEQVLASEQPRLCRLVRRMLGWSFPSAVDDLVQETFVRALTAQQRFNGSATLETWLTRIAINECRAYLRKERRRQVLLGWWHRQQPLAVAPPGNQSTELDETTTAVRLAIARLSPTSREVIVLHYLEQLPVEHVAKALHLKPGTVSTRLTRARAQLGRLLDESLLEE